MLVPSLKMIIAMITRPQRGEFQLVGGGRRVEGLGAGLPDQKRAGGR
jgi:hypothetical protein